MIRDRRAPCGRATATHVRGEEVSDPDERAPSVAPRPARTAANPDRQWLTIMVNNYGEDLINMLDRPKGPVRITSFSRLYSLVNLSGLNDGRGTSP